MHIMYLCACVRACVCECVCVCVRACVRAVTMASYSLVSVCLWLIIGACQPAKLSRFHLDAGRVLYLDLQFEEAVTHLNSSPIDPREVIAMYPDLQPPNFAYRSK